MLEVTNNYLDGFPLYSIWHPWQNEVHRDHIELLMSLPCRKSAATSRNHMRHLQPSGLKATLAKLTTKSCIQSRVDTNQNLASMKVFQDMLILEVCNMTITPVSHPTPSVCALIFFKGLFSS